LHQAGQVFSDSVVQALILFTHYAALAARDIVGVHGELHYYAIQCQKEVEGFVHIVADYELLAQIALFLSWCCFSSPFAPGWMIKRLLATTNCK
jgi:hypothetical protein